MGKMKVPAGQSHRKLLPLQTAGPRQGAAGCWSQSSAWPRDTSSSCGGRHKAASGNICNQINDANSAWRRAEGKAGGHWGESTEARDKQGTRPAASPAASADPRAEARVNQQWEGPRSQPVPAMPGSPAPTHRAQLPGCQAQPQSPGSPSLARTDQLPPHRIRFQTLRGPSSPGCGYPASSGPAANACAANAGGINKLEHSGRWLEHCTCPRAWPGRPSTLPAACFPG